MTRRSHALLFALALTLVGASPAYGQIRGDVNGDGGVSATDGLGVLSSVVRLPLPDGWIAYPDGDASGDGRLSVLDALVILSYVVGRDVGAFPVGDLMGDLRMGAGEHVVPELRIPEGRTVVLDGDVHIRSTGPIVIDGVFQGDCTGATLESEAEVVVTGFVRTECAEPPADAPAPSLVIAPTGPFRIEGATITASGDIQVGAPVDTVRGGSPPPPGSGQAPSGPAAPCVARGSTFAHSPARAPGGRDGADIGLSGERCGVLLAEDLLLRAQAGGVGEDRILVGSAELVTAEAGNGGRGGWAALLYANLSGRIELIGGAGGDGGDATAVHYGPGGGTSIRASSGRAVGGDGGDGGGVFTDWAVDKGTSQLFVYTGRGGHGGNASAAGADGLDADGSDPPQEGGSATANPGRGGSGGQWASQVPADGGFTGEGGDAGNVISGPGFGGSGNGSHPDGARGGTAVVYLTTPGEAGVDRDFPLARGLDGEWGTVSVFKGGGGAGAEACDPGEGPAGAGGAAGDLALVGELDRYAGRFRIEDAFQGGPGGDGTPPGAGGPVEGGGLLREYITVINSFRPGPNGLPCDAAGPFDGEVAVQSDPDGHDGSLLNLGSQPRDATLNATRGSYVVELVLDAPTASWSLPGLPPLTGEFVSGTEFTAAGTADLAGLSGVPLEAAGTLVDGVLTVDITIGPDGELYGGAPIVYRFTGSLPAAAGAGR